MICNWCWENQIFSHLSTQEKTDWYEEKKIILLKIRFCSHTEYWGRINEWLFDGFYNNESAKAFKKASILVTVRFSIIDLMLGVKGTIIAVKMEKKVFAFF